MNKILTSCSIIAISSFLACGVALAAPHSVANSQSSTIMLGNPGTILPGSTIELNLSLLKSDDYVPYDVTCIIDNSFYQQPDPVVLNISAGGADLSGPSAISVNGISQEGPSYNLSTKEESNSFEVSNVAVSSNGDGYIKFKNLDNAAHVEVGFCMAKPHINAQ